MAIGLTMMSLRNDRSFFNRGEWLVSSSEVPQSFFMSSVSGKEGRVLETPSFLRFSYVREKTMFSAERDMGERYGHDITRYSEISCPTS